LLSALFSCKKNKDEKDTTPPAITIKGEISLLVEPNTTYIDSGATAYDETDGDITSKIVVTNNVNTSVIGFYTVKYNVSDNAGNAATEAIRNLEVKYMK